MTEQFEKKLNRLNKEYTNFSDKILIKESSLKLKEQQTKFLQKLEGIKEFEFLYFIVHIEKNIPLSNKTGGLEILYKPGIFDMERYLKSLRPEFSRYHEIQATYYIKELAGGGFKEQLNDDQPLRWLLKSFQSIKSDWDNKIYKVKRFLYPFAYNQNGQVYEYLNLLMLCDEASEYDTYKIEGGSHQSLNDEIIKEVKKVLGFRAPHIDYLDKYNEILNSTYPGESKREKIKAIEVKMVDGHTTTERPTLRNYEKEINEKITKIFGIPNFPHFEDAIHFLRNHNLLPRH